MSRNCLVLILLLSLVLAVPAGLGQGPLYSVVELRALDLMFVLRGNQEPISTEPSVVMIGIDTKSLREQARNTVFWLEDIGLVCKALVEAGALCVGIDLLVGDNGLGGGLETPKYRAVREVLEQEESVLLEALASEKVVLAQYYELRTKTLVPNPEPGEGVAFNALATMAQSQGNLCLVNVGQEQGVVRTVPYLTRQNDPTPGSRMFAFRLVELARGKLFELKGNRLYLGDDEIPTELDGEVPMIRVNYPGPHDIWGSAFPRRASFVDLLREVKSGKPLEGYQNSICILFYQDFAEQDYRTTPYNLATGFDSAGAEIHASLVNSLLTGRLITRAGPGAWVGLTLALAMAVGWAAFRLRWYLSLPIALLVLVGYFFGAVALFAQQGLWIPLVTPILAGVGAYLVAYVARYDLVKRLLGSMVGSQVRDRMLEETELTMLRGERRRVTVLFSDINDFTPVTERSTPDRVITMLNEYFGAMSEIIEKHGGHLKQFVGDAIMVIYNAPSDQPDHAARAVMTGLEMIERLEEMKVNAQGREGFYEVKIGINTGDVVVGNVGTAKRMEYAAVGDDVNLGARIETLTKKLGAFLLVSAATKKEAEGNLPGVEWISRGVQQFKGKTAEMEVFEVRRKK